MGKRPREENTGWEIIGMEKSGGERIGVEKTWGKSRVLKDRLVRTRGKIPKEKRPVRKDQSGKTLMGKKKGLKEPGGKDLAPPK